MNIKKTSGFTLIELMIVLVIISVILAYAIPNYRLYVLKTKRTEAKNALLLTASLQERFYANNNRYGTAVELKLATTYPAPTAANELNYTISLSVSTNTTYTISAVAYGLQAQDTDCLTFTLDHLGTKTPAASDCW